MVKHTNVTSSNLHYPINSRVSRQILWAIHKDMPINPRTLPKEISIEQIEKLRTLYKTQVKKYATHGSHPRNEIFYNLIQDKIPSFTWKAIVKDNNKWRVIFNTPRINNREISLLALLLNDIQLEQSSILKQRYNTLEKLPPLLIDEIDALFKTLQVIYPNQLNMQEIIAWLQKGLHGESLQIFSLACPDYSVEKINNPKQPFRHTFNELGSGIGLIAKRALEAFPLIDQTLKKFGIQFTPILALADYEVLVDANLTRLKLSFDEFEKKLQMSRNSFQSACPIVIKTPMITELCGGYQAWKCLLTSFQNRFKSNDFGQSSINRQMLLSIVKARKQLYDRWLGPREHIEDYIPQLLDQGAEYAAVGAIIKQLYPNCLILGADHSALAPFYNIDQFIPSLYLKRFYC